jgi:hypothetical protein
MKERTAEVVAQAKHLRQEARITQEKSRETSILKVVFPQSIAGEYHHTSAHLWGEPQYGGKIEANIVYLGNTGCSESDYRDLSNAEPKNLIVEGAEGISYFKAPYILMIDRGGCNFVPKVRRAQQFGASAVLISDHLCLCSEVDRGTCHSPEKQCEATSPLMADDGSGGDVTIPSFLIWNTESNNIKQQLGYDENVLVEMAWNLPAPDDRVEWDMWTSSWDPTGLPFKTNFVNTVAALGDAAFFQPHWQIITHESCRSPEQFCFNQCTNQGRYCQVDPDGNSEEALQIGLSGADVIREDLREMCIWELSQDKSPGIGLQWWQYVTNHSEHCSTENGVPSPEKVRARYIPTTKNRPATHTHLPPPPPSQLNSYIARHASIITHVQISAQPMPKNLQHTQQTSNAPLRNVTANSHPQKTTNITHFTLAGTIYKVEERRLRTYNDGHCGHRQIRRHGMHAEQRWTGGRRD